MAEEQGFEPWEDFHPRRFSRPVHSTTLPLLRQALHNGVKMIQQEQECRQGARNRLYLLSSNTGLFTGAKIGLGWRWSLQFFGPDDDAQKTREFDSKLDPAGAPGLDIAATVAQ